MQATTSSPRNLDRRWADSLPDAGGSSAVARGAQRGGDLLRVVLAAPTDCDEVESG
jgi:hypothetical protein